MKKGRFSEEQIIGILKQHEAGRKVADLAREHGISEATIYTWKSKYGGLEVNEAQRLKSLEDENRRLKHLVADLSLDKEVLKAIVRKNLWSAAGLQALVLRYGESLRKSIRPVCGQSPGLDEYPRVPVLITVTAWGPVFSSGLRHADKLFRHLSAVASKLG
jgi:putative transposase